LVLIAARGKIESARAAAARAILGMPAPEAATKSGRAPGAMPGPSWAELLGEPQ
jgi:hypothetical protein